MEPDCWHTKLARFWGGLFKVGAEGNLIGTKDDSGQTKTAARVVGNAKIYLYPVKDRMAIAAKLEKGQAEITEVHFRKVSECETKECNKNKCMGKTRNIYISVRSLQKNKGVRMHGSG